MPPEQEGPSPDPRVDRRIDELRRAKRLLEATLCDYLDRYQLLREEVDELRARLTVADGQPAPSNRVPVAHESTIYAHDVEEPDLVPAQEGRHDSTSSASDAKPEPEQVDPDLEVIATTFVAWCNRGGPLVSRYFMFEKFLQKQVAGAQVRPTYRNHGASRVEFVSHSADPVEYWVAELDQRQWLLPQPQNDGQFRELEPCFTLDGTVAPRNLARIAPPLLVLDEGRYVLERPGHLSEAHLSADE